MLFQGRAFTLKALTGGFAELQFDLQSESVNKLNMLAMTELEQVLGVLEAATDIKGLLISSAKSAFIVGADIMEFSGLFAAGDEAVKQALARCNRNYCRLEDLPFPTLAAINGYALGGGMELSLACDFRLLAKDAKVGLPEVKLGIIPGWGGTVRLPRLAGLDVAVEWIASGKEQSAATALAAGVADGVVAVDDLLTSSMDVLVRAAEGKLDWQNRRRQKQSPLRHNDMESLMAFESSKVFVKAQAGYHYPAPVAAIQVMQDAAKCARDEALSMETAAFSRLAQSDVAQALVGIFMSDQLLAKKAKKLAAVVAGAVEKIAVVGAGIMGGGIAYQSALKGVPTLMKDIAQSGLDLGLKEASKLLVKRLERGRMSVVDMGQVLNRIVPTLSYEGFWAVDVAIEAVVENPKVKHGVLAEIESNISDQAILCSNTSTISIDYLAQCLTRPENFCGMHFFNPVHAMPLVEVIRGSQTSDATIAKAVAHASTLGKKVVVVNDCPGFLVNRVLFPYFAGFSLLLRDGVDFQVVDKVMERWGWPMGPAYLLDVVGLDTAVHAESVMRKGFPDRMARDYVAATNVLFDAGRLGQKNGHGFYDYSSDRKGKPQKNASEDPYQLFKAHCAPQQDFSEQDIIARMMIPMATELMCCLQEGIVASAAEADMALVYGLGFPPFRGGLLRWVDMLGLSEFESMAAPLAKLGPLYELPDIFRQTLARGDTFYGND